MSWSTTRGAGTDPKYRTKEHRELSADYKRRIRDGEILTCSAIVCVLASRAITNPNGNHRDGVTVGHEDDGTTYRGPEHRACNLHDAAVRASARSHGKADRPRTPQAPRRWTL